MKQTVRQFWDSQAQEHGASPVATAPDVHYRELEIRAAISVMHKPKRVLDVGCGNGYTTLALSKKFPRAKFIGVDSSIDMIAKATPDRNVAFQVGDCLHLDTALGSFDHIISVRCLINLKGWQEQRAAILGMIDRLKVGGRLILIENTSDGLKRLNKVRRIVGLPAIRHRWHNHYMPYDKTLKLLRRHLNVIDVCNIGSPYYLISRVVYAKLCAVMGKEPSYNHPINAIASKLPVMGDCSPNYVFVGVKR